jgi:Protein of unknown function (DUF3738)
MKPGVESARAQSSPSFVAADDTNLFHADARGQLSYQAAVITPSKNQSPGPPSLDAAPHELITEHSTLKDLVRFAYHAKSADQIIGGPIWMSTKFFDVNAKASDSDIRRMMEMSVTDRIVVPRYIVIAGRPFQAQRPLRKAGPAGLRAGGSERRAQAQRS